MNAGHVLKILMLKNILHFILASNKLIIWERSANAVIGIVLPRINHQQYKMKFLWVAVLKEIDSVHHSACYGTTKAQGTFFTPFLFSWLLKKTDEPTFTLLDVM